MSAHTPRTGHKDWVQSAAVSPDGQYVASTSGSNIRTFRLWDAATGEAVCEPLQGHMGLVSSVGFSPDSRRIVSGPTDKNAKDMGHREPSEPCT